MRRIVLVLAIAATLVVMLAVPAFAAKNPDANCIGEIASLNDPGFVGEVATQQGGLYIAQSAGPNCATG